MLAQSASPAASPVWAMYAQFEPSIIGAAPANVIAPTQPLLLVVLVLEVDVVLVLVAELLLVVAHADTPQ